MHSLDEPMMQKMITEAEAYSVKTEVYCNKALCCSLGNSQFSREKVHPPPLHHPFGPQSSLEGEGGV